MFVIPPGPLPAHGMTDVQRPKTTLANLAVEHPGSLRVFEQFGIDYSCSGKLSLTEACRRVGLTESEFHRLLALTETNPQPLSVRPQDWSLELLITYIVQNHHRYIRRMAPVISSLLEDAAAVAPPELPLTEIQQEFCHFIHEMEDHMRKEEVVLFPAIQWLSRQCSAGKSGPDALEVRLGYSVGTLENAHQEAAGNFDIIRHLTNQYTAAPTAAPVLRLLMQRLKEFESDLHTHMHLENNLLFPKALALEAALLHEA